MTPALLERLNFAHRLQKKHAYINPNNGGEFQRRRGYLTFCDLSFPDDAVATSFAAFASCREWADAWAVLSQQADYKSNQLFKTLVAGGDYTQDGAYTVWQMNISDEAAYVSAYKKLMAAQIKEGLLSGGYGLWRVQGGANSNVTHIAFAGAKDISALLSNTNPSKAFLAFLEEVAGIRKVHRQNINTVVADL